MGEYTGVIAISLFVLGLGSAVMGFALRTLYTESKDNKKELTEHKLHVAKEYPTRSELNAIVLMVDKRMDKMERWIGRRFDEVLARKSPPHDEEE